MQDPSEKHFGDVGILVKYEVNNNNNNESDINFIRNHVIEDAAMNNDGLFTMRSRKVWRSAHMSKNLWLLRTITRAREVTQTKA